MCSRPPDRPRHNSGAQPRASRGLVDHPRLIDQDYAVGRTERLGNRVLMTGDHRCARPSALADEMLQVANAHPLRQGDTFTGFAGLLAQQTVTEIREVLLRRLGVRAHEA